jgi:hypothetical protein
MSAAAQRIGHDCHDHSIIRVIDHHHHALRSLLSLSPQPGRTLVHFDSHPDLAVPPAEAVIFDDSDNIETTVAVCDIANWILVLVARGIFDRVVWNDTVRAHECK